MIERTSVKSFTKLPKGTRCMFRVMGKPEKIPVGKTTARVWKLQPDIPGINAEIEYKVFPWQSKGILIAVGGKLVDDDVEWDDDKVDGKVFTATVDYVDGTKTNPNTGKPYQNLVLTDFEMELDF